MWQTLLSSEYGTVSQPHALPLHPPDFVAMFERFPRRNEQPDELLDTVLCVQGHCWAARLRLVYEVEKTGALAEVWLRHRERALALFQAHAEFRAWRHGEQMLGRVVSIS